MAALVYIHSLVSTVKGAVSTGVLRILLFHFSGQVCGDRVRERKIALFATTRESIWQ
jgi:hypothetical protein